MSRSRIQTLSSNLTCEDLPSPALESLVHLNPNLSSLRLDFCGHLDDVAFKLFITSLPGLTHLELLGPFLVRSASWQKFFKSHIILESFLITQSPRFDLDCTASMVKYCKGLKELRLKEVGKLDDDFLEELEGLGGGLRLLDLSDPSNSCSEEAMIKLLSVIGTSLNHLNLSKHILMSDTFLEDGLKHYAHSIEYLSLAYLPELTDDGVANFFDTWEAPPLQYINLARNHELSSNALESLLKHSGARLQDLTMNGWKNVEEPALRLIGIYGVELRKLDVGWCRAMDNFVLKLLLYGEEVHGVHRGGCPRLEEVKMWGCNKITDDCPGKVSSSRLI